MTWKEFQIKYEFTSGVIGVALVCGISLFFLWLFDLFGAGYSNQHFTDPSLYPYVNSIEDY